MADQALDYLLENWKQLINCEGIVAEKHQITTLIEELSYLSTLLKDSEMCRHDYPKVKDLVCKIIDLAFEVEDIIDSSMVNSILKKNRRKRIMSFFGFHRPHQMFNNSRTLRDVLKDIESLKKEVSDIYANKLYGIIRDPQLPAKISSRRLRSSDPVFIDEETVVGLDGEVETLKQRLVGGSKQLDVISIVGIAGLGKTTLASKLYKDDFVQYHFYIRAWASVSLAYEKSDVLLSILLSFGEHSDRDQLYNMNNEKLGEMMYKCLKGKRYLIVMDDIWNTKPWDDMKILFPNDNNGSRIIITSQLTAVGLHVKHNSPPHLLRFLTDDESWELLKKKVFWKESCPPDLVGVGKKIAQKCQGLPLTIVVVAGRLVTIYNKRELWESLSRNFSEYIARPHDIPYQIMALSYNHLPGHLRLCYLYFGAFPKNSDIRVRKLICLWIAEGFIRQIGQKTLEDVAEEYLTDLNDQCFVVVTKRKSTGGIKTCRVHDRLHEFCLRKGKEENFMQQISTYETFPYFSDPSSSCSPIKGKQRRLCIFSHTLEHISSKYCAPHIRSFFTFPSTCKYLLQKDISCFCKSFKLLRVLDLSTIDLAHFPSEMLQLVLLRYLELHGCNLTLPKSISDLLYLETLDVSSSQYTSAIVPPDIWKMVNLRHLRINGKYDAFPLIHTSSAGYAGYPSVLPNLQTILQLCPSKSSEIILARTPNLRKLGFYGCFESVEGNLWFPDLYSLIHLETLKFLNRTTLLTREHSGRWSLQGFKFPPNLRRLTLSNTNLDWEEMSTLGMLCNLEVLKLEYSACVGPRWETTSEGFKKLKFLRLRHINIEQWEASDTDFPSLQQLVLQDCRELEGIPFNFGNIPTLQTIEVTRCSQSTENSASNIQEEQQDMGNDWLKILIDS